MGRYLEIVRAAKPAETLGPWAPPLPVTTRSEPAAGEPSGWIQDALSRPWVAARWAGSTDALADKSIDSVAFVLALDLRVLGLNRTRIIKALIEWPLRPRSMGWAQQTADRVERYVKGYERNEFYERSGDPPTLFDLGVPS